MAVAPAVIAQRAAKTKLVQGYIDRIIEQSRGDDPCPYTPVGEFIPKMKNNQGAAIGEISGVYVWEEKTSGNFITIDAETLVT